MSEDRDMYGSFDPDEEFVLNVDEVQMLLHFVDGDEDLIDKDEFNSLLTDMAAFVDGDLEDDDEEYDEPSG